MHATLVNSLVLGKMDYSFFDLNQRYQNSGILARNQQVYINALIDVVQSNFSETIMAEEEKKLEKLWTDGSSSPRLVYIQCFMYNLTCFYSVRIKSNNDNF